MPAVRGLASYTIPRVDVLVSTAVRFQPPLARTATWLVPNSLVSQPQYLGRVPPGGTAGGNTNVTITDNEHRLFADNRRTQIDMRVAKIFRVGKTRLDVGVDGENLLNTNYTTTYESSISTRAAIPVWAARGATRPRSTRRVTRA